MRLLAVFFLLASSQAALSQSIPSVSNPFGRTAVRTDPGLDVELQAVPEWAWTITPAFVTASNVNVGILNLAAEKGAHTFQATMAHADPDGADNLWQGEFEYTFNALKNERLALDTTFSLKRIESTATAYTGSLGASYVLVSGNDSGVGRVTLATSAGWVQQNPDADHAETADDARLSVGIGWRASEKLSLRTEYTAENDIDGASAWTGSVAYGPAMVRYTQGGEWLVAWGIPLP